jgi:hypothetical protein
MKKTKNKPNSFIESKIFLKEYMQRRFIKSIMITYNLIIPNENILKLFQV